MAFEDVEVGLDAVLGEGLGLEEGVEVGPLGVEAFVIFGVGAGYDADESVDKLQRAFHLLLLNTILCTQDQGFGCSV